MRSAQVHESGASVLVAGLLVMVCVVARDLAMQCMLHDVRELLGQLHAWKHGKQQHDRERAHDPTVTDG